jgi:hypothetical protein
MLPTHTWLGVATVKLRSSRSRLSAIGRSCHLSIVVMQKWRLPRARMPYRCITSAPAACLHRCPESAVVAISSAVGRRPDPPHKRRSYAPAAPRAVKVASQQDILGTNKVSTADRHAHAQNSASHPDRPHTPATSNKGVLHLLAIREVCRRFSAFPKMSRSILTSANSSCNRLISIRSPYRLAAVGALRSSLPLRLDPVGQRLFHHN